MAPDWWKTCTVCEKPNGLTERSQVVHLEDTWCAECVDRIHNAPSVAIGTFRI